MGTGSAKDYTTVFKTYQTRCGYNDMALIEEYRRGLKKSLEERCRMTYPKPKKLAEWMERAVDINKEYRIGQSKYAHKGNTTQSAPKARFEPRRDSPRAPAPPNNSFVRRDLNTMDVNAT